MQIDLSVRHQQILGAGCIHRMVVERTCGVVYLNLHFDEEWQDCAVTVLLSNSRADGGTVALLWKGEPLEIPPQLLVSGVLKLSCVGLRTGDGVGLRKRLTTARMAEGIRIHAAGEQSGFAPGSTVPGLWEQTLAAVGPLEELKTADKTSLVAAVNGLLGRDQGGTAVGIASVEQTVTSEESGGVNAITVTLTDGTTQVLTVRNGTAGRAGKDGKDGKDGRDGTDGKTPVKGVDYFTDAEVEQIIRQAAAQAGGGPALQNAMEVYF